MKIYSIISKDSYQIYEFEKSDRKQDGRAPTTIINCWNGPVMLIATLFKLLSGNARRYSIGSDYKELLVLQGGEISQLLTHPKKIFHTGNDYIRARFPRSLRNKAKKDE